MKTRKPNSRLRPASIRAFSISRIGSLSFVFETENGAMPSSAYELAIQLEPGFAPPYEDLAELLCVAPDSEIRDPPRAVELAAKAVQLDPTAVRGKYVLGLAQFRVGQWQASIDALEDR